jgi:hypothetical protein
MWNAGPNNSDLVFSPHSAAVTTTTTIGLILMILAWIDRFFFTQVSRCIYRPQLPMAISSVLVEQSESLAQWTNVVL